MSRARQLEELRQRVETMRTCQRRWFEGDKSDAMLAAAKAAEDHVDKQLARLRGPGLFDSGPSNRAQLQAILVDLRAGRVRFAIAGIENLLGGAS